MTIFPALVPSSRVFTPGEYPNTPYPALGRGETRVRHSNVMINSTLRVSFAGLTEQDVVDILNHYQSQSGAWVPFDLPANLWSGVSDQADFELAGYFWRYSQPPEVEDQPCRPDGSMVYNVSIEFETVTPEGSITNSRIFRANITWSPGTAQGLAAGAGLAAGFNITIFAEWSELPPDGESSPAELEATIVWTPGSATVNYGFGIELYTGNATARTISGYGFEPGMVWIKARSQAEGHWIFDHVRGATKYWRADFNSVEATTAQTLTAFTGDGFSYGTSATGNSNTIAYVAYAWAKGPASSSNTDGSTSVSLSHNSAMGMSIGLYTGTGSATSIGHGLGVIPEVVIIRPLNGSQASVGGSLIGNNQLVALNTNEAKATNSNRLQSFTSSVVNIGNQCSVSSVGHAVYAFTSVSGATKFGIYTGTGATDQSISIGFAPRLLIIKAVSSTGNWRIFDTSRGDDKVLFGNTQDGESTLSPQTVTLDATGFTAKANLNNNTSSVDYLYLAFR